MTDLHASRRNMLTGLAAAGLAVPVIAACGGGDDVTGSTAGDPSTSGDAGASGGSPSDGASSGGIKTSDIPVGGGKIFKDEKLVVTQPSSGDFKAFSAVCTHAGCVVAKISDGTIDCPCHGSKYSIEDGSVEDGPAPKPLPEKTVTVSPAGDTLTVA